MSKTGTTTKARARFRDRSSLLLEGVYHFIISVYNQHKLTFFRKKNLVKIIFFIVFFSPIDRLHISSYIGFCALVLYVVVNHLARILD